MEILPGTPTSAPPTTPTTTSTASPRNPPPPTPCSPSPTAPSPTPNTYDLVGNRLSKAIDADNNAVFEKTISYIYNHSDLLEREEVAGITTVSYAYDPNGSLIQKNNIEDTEDYVYTYNAEDRMASAKLNAGAVTDYAYDPNGIKVQVGTTNLLIDPNNPTGYAQVFEEKDAGTGTRSTKAAHDPEV